MPETLRNRLAAELPHLRRFARSLESDAAAADDLVQTCLERALRKLHLWRPEGAFRSWLFRILYREYLSARRKASNRQDTVPIEDAQEWMAAPAKQADQLHCRDVMDALATLPADQRAAVSLIASSGVSYAEAARILDVPEGTLRSRLARGRATLRTLTSTDAAATPPNHLRRVK